MCHSALRNNEQELAKRLPESAKCTTFARREVHELHTRFGGSEASEEVEGGLDIHSMQESVAYIFFFSLLVSPLFLLGRQKTFSCSAGQSEGRKDKGLAGFNTSFSVSMRKGGRKEGYRAGTRWGLWQWRLSRKGE